MKEIQLANDKGVAIRDNEDIHEAVIEGVCSCCKGFNTCHYGDWNNMDCDGYNEEYDEIEKEWAEEDRVCEDDTWVHDPDMEAR